MFRSDERNEKEIGWMQKVWCGTSASKNYDIYSQLQALLSQPSNRGVGATIRGVSATADSLHALFLTPLKPLGLVVSNHIRLPPDKVHKYLHKSLLLASYIKKMVFHAVFCTLTTHFSIANYNCLPKMCGALCPNLADLNTAREPSETFYTFIEGSTSIISVWYNKSQPDLILIKSSHQVTANLADHVHTSAHTSQA